MEVEKKYFNFSGKFKEEEAKKDELLYTKLEVQFNVTWNTNVPYVRLGIIC